MATSLAEIRAKLKAQETRSSGGASFGSDNTIYPHWDIDEGATARLRFLPDKDIKNTFFWVERQIINLQFAGIKGQTDSKPVTVQVPCVEMWNETCPILAEVRTWFKDTSLEEMGRKYWKKRSYLFQGFVRDNPLKEESPANPIRRFIISPQIFNIVKGALMDPEMEELPTDYLAGLDFQASKSAKGGYADYSTSKWSRKDTALTAEELKAIDEYGLFNLADFLPKKPTEAELQIMKDMFEASVDGQPYDTERWGSHFRPRGVQAPATQTVASSPVTADRAVATEHIEVNEPVYAPVAPTVIAEDDLPFEPTAPVVPQAGSGQRAEDILAMIRSRQQKS